MSTRSWSVMQALAFVLQTADEQLAVYAAGVEEAFRPLVGRSLRMRDKVVDFTREGGTRELWISAILASGED